MDKKKLIAAPVLLFVGCVFLLVMWFFSNILLAEYGTQSGSLIGGAWWGFNEGAVFGIIAALLAMTALWVARGSKTIRVVGVLIAVAGIGGPFVGGALAAKQKFADLPDGPYCYSRGHAPALRAVLRPVDRAFRELDHPAEFSGGGGNGYDGCSDGLLNIDMTASEAHYRRELPRHGWTVRDDSTKPLTATRGDLKFRLLRLDGLPTVHIGPINPTLP